MIVLEIFCPINQACQWEPHNRVRAVINIRQANHFAGAIDSAGNITNFTENRAGKRFLLSLVHTCYTNSIFPCILKENLQKPTRRIFRFFSYSCRIKFQLIHLPKKVKSTLTLSINVRLKVVELSAF